MKKAPPKPAAARRSFSEVHRVVSQVPEGRVATYGQVARLVGGITPLFVGWAMAALPEDSDVPWHRVLNAKGAIPAAEKRGTTAVVQRALLEAEGVVFVGGKVDLALCGWKPTEPSRTSTPSDLP